MKKKKLIIIVLVTVLVIGGITGGIGGYQVYRKSKMTVDVQSVANLNWGYWGDDMSSEGMITNDSSQDIFVTPEQTVKEIFVQEGQEVAVGDPLLQYDVTTIDLQIEMKELEIEGIKNNITALQKELTTLKNTKPKSTTPPVVEEPAEPIVEEKTGEAYNYISATAVPFAGDGSAGNPFRFLCTPEAYVYGSYLNYLASNGYMANFEVHVDDTVDGAIQTSWTVNGVTLEERDPEAKWYIADGSKMEEVIPEIPVIPEEGYTAEELAKEIAQKERDIATQDLNRRTAELQLVDLQNQSEDGMVYAKIDGVVKTVGDPEELPNDGSAFLSVTGSDGLYVTGSLSEMVLDQVEIGQYVGVTSWETGEMCDATITSINDYPEESNNYYYGSGNPNASYYGYTAYIENPGDLKVGDYVGLTMNLGGSETDMSSIFIEKAYVRTEDGKSYVMKEDETGHLVKQYVETGRTLYGSAIEIKAGLTEDDYIAFPYGKTVKEGVKTNRDSSMGYYY